MKETPQQVLQKQIEVYQSVQDNIEKNKTSLSREKYEEVFYACNRQIISFTKAIKTLNDAEAKIACN